MKKIFQVICLLVLTQCLVLATEEINSNTRRVLNFGKEWKFNLGDNAEVFRPEFDDSKWRELNLPHDWSIEGKFSKDNPATPGGGALPGGIGWYRKTFSLNDNEKEKLFFIDFDGVYRNSEVWINGHYLGKRPYGYSSFRYELTSYLNFDSKKNVIAVKVDNSKQPNSRWYSGSGIYRNVWLVSTNKIHVGHWGTFITTPSVSKNFASIDLQITLQNQLNTDKLVVVRTNILDAKENVVASTKTENSIKKNVSTSITHQLKVNNPMLWTVKNPNLYKAVTTVEVNGEIADQYDTPFGIRTFIFDNKKGFVLNGEQIKINGVCNHHDLGFLGAAVNKRALERQLELMKGMGVNGIRTSHNPPAPELLDLCDRMGFIVMDESFDMWKKGKTPFDYSLDWDEWHKRDLEDLILRDRNHPSVFIWSIGNEVLEQHDRNVTDGADITKELVVIVKQLDNTRPVTAACNAADPDNPLIKSGALDLIGYNYHHETYVETPKLYPDKPFISAESVSALQTRGYYDMPSDSIHIWPEQWDKPFLDGNPDNTCSAYDNCHAPWGSTHEETWKVVKKHDFISGQYIWTGMDYLGEPTPYSWPSRSSYFGIVDLAGFPKDIYYMYKSEWTDEPVLHVFPHWSLPDRQAGWERGKIVDVWAYTNCDDVELFLNGKSLGTKSKAVDDLHLIWRVTYEPGTLKAVGKKNEKEVLVKEIKTAGAPAKIILEADRKEIAANGNDLSFITVKIVDEFGTLVPTANNLVRFKIIGEGIIAGVDNGSQTSMESFKADYRNAFNGKCLVVIKSNGKPGKIVLSAISDGLEEATEIINAK